MSECNDRCVAFIDYQAVGALAVGRPEDLHR
jgi:hypothetical protein